MIAKLLEPIRRWMLRHSPQVVETTLEQESSGVGARFTVIYRIEFVSRRRGFVVFRHARSRRLTIDERAAAATGWTRTQNGWGVEVHPASTDALLRLRCEWDSKPLTLPDDAPTPVLGDHRPSRMVACLVALTDDAIVSTRIEDSRSPRGSLSVTISRATVAHKGELGEGLVQLLLFSSTGESVSELHHQKVVALMERAWSKIAMHMTSSPSGVLGIDFDADVSWIFNRHPSRINVERLWLEPGYPPHAAEWNIAWQLTAAWWGGLVRLVDADGYRMAIALRLLTMSVAYAENVATRGVSTRASSHVRSEAERALASGSSSADREWYKDSLTFGGRLERTNESNGQVWRAMREAFALAAGSQVEVTWFAQRLASVGVGPTSESPGE